MAAQSGMVLALVGTATAINAVHAANVKSPQDAFGVLFGGVALFGAIASLGSFYDWRVAKSLAFLFLLGTLMLRGEKTAKWLSDAVGSFE